MDKKTGLVCDGSRGKGIRLFHDYGIAGVNGGSKTRSFVAARNLSQFFCYFTSVRSALALLKDKESIPLILAAWASNLAGRNMSKA